MDLASGAPSRKATISRASEARLTQPKHPGREQRVRCAVVVATSTRGPGTDASGRLAVELLVDAGLESGQPSFADDDVEALRAAVQSLVEGGARVIIVTGGTGITRRDVTPEAIEPLYDKHLPGFGEAFRAASMRAIGVDGLLSRSSAGVIGEALLFLIPGSPGAVRDAMPLIVGAARHAIALLDAPERVGRP